LAELEQLYAQFNNLEQITHIVKLKKLKNLSLANNRIHIIPNDIALLINLTALDVCNNAITTLPPEIGLLTNLTALNLSCNKLQTLPDEFCKLHQLKQLDLHTNQLRNLPNDFCKLVNISYAHFQNNLFRVFPGYLLHMPMYCFWHINIPTVEAKSWTELSSLLDLSCNVLLQYHILDSLNQNLNVILPQDLIIYLQTEIKSCWQCKKKILWSI